MNQKIPSYKFNNGTHIIDVDNINFCEEIYYSQEFDLLKENIIVDTSFYNWASNLKIVCNTKRIFSLVGTIYFTASIAGYIALSKFPDRYGRRTVYLYLNFFSLLSVIQLLFLHNYIQILIASFVLGLSSLNMATASVLVNENIDCNYTALIMGISMAMFPLGGLINTFLMFFISDWRYYLIIIIFVLAFNNYLGFFYLVESPKWLIANHRTKEYFECILFIAKVNGNYDETIKFIQLKNPRIKRSESNENEYGFKEDYRKIVYEVSDLFKYPSMRLLTIFNIYLWVISGFSFYGILLNLEGLTGNIYIDSIVSYTAELLAELISGYLADKYGRKTILFWSFFIASIGCGLFSLSFHVLISIPLIFIACIGIASGFNVLYIYSAELYPTNIKSLAVAVFFVSNRLFAAAVPIILNYINNVVFIIFIFSTISVLIMHLLPETLNTDSGDEVPEMVNKIYENESNISKSDAFVSFNGIFDEND
jgi:MFS family permease